MIFLPKYGKLNNQRQWSSHLLCFVRIFTFNEVKNENACSKFWVRYNPLHSKHAWFKQIGLRKVNWVCNLKVFSSFARWELFFFATENIALWSLTHSQSPYCNRRNKTVHRKPPKLKRLLYYVCIFIFGEAKNENALLILHFMHSCVSSLFL